MNFKQYQLAPIFSEDIQSLWSIQFGNQAELIPIIPDGYPEIIIPLYGEIRSFIANKKTIHTLNCPCIIGQLGGISYLQSLGKAAFVSIKLYPWLLSSVLKDKATMAKNQWVDASLVLSQKTVQALEELRHCKEDTHLQYHLQTVALPLVWQSLKQTKVPVKPIAAYSVQQFFGAAGQLTSTELASKLNCSRRYLELIFKDFIGISPKQYARIIRTKKASILLRNAAKEQLNLSNISFDMGYYDLSHFNKDFKAITERSPSRFLEELEGGHALYRDEIYLGQWGYS